MLPPDARPQILWIALSTVSPHAGDTVCGIVLASSNVASVEMRIGGYSINVPKTDVGRFQGNYRVPGLPFFMSHNLVMRVIARNTGGVAAESDLNFQIR